MLRRFSIRQVILGSLAVLGLVAGGGVLVMLVAAESMRTDAARQTDQLAVDEAIADNIVRHVRRQLDAVDRYTQTGNSAEIARFRAEGMAVHDEVRRYLFRDLRRQERRVVERIRETHQLIEVEAQAILSPDSETGVARMLPGADQLEAELATLIDLRRAAIRQALREGTSTWLLLYALSAALVLIFLTALLAIGRFLQQRLLLPLDALSAAAARIGAGDLDTRVVSTRSDELAAVGDSFNRMADRLRTERRAAALAEHRYRDLVEGLSSVVWEADAETLRYTYVSPRAEQMLGYAQAEWTAEGFWQRIVHPDDWADTLLACTSAVAEGRDHELVYRAVHADGSVVWIRDSVKIGMNEAGAPQWLRGTFSDITLERAAAEALRNSEERYHSLFDRVPVGLYRSTPAGQLIDVNPAFAAMFGYASREELVGRDAADMYVDSVERLRWQASLEATDGMMAEDRMHLHRDGRILWLRDSCRAVRDPNGVVQFYEGAVQDITERVAAEEAVRHSEARFRSLIENASDGVLILDGDARITYQSPAIERMLGYPLETMQGRSPFDLVHPEDVDEVVRSFTNVKTPTGHGTSVEFRCRHANGSWRTLHVMGTNLLHDPAVNGIVLNMIDATALRSLQEQLQHAQRLDAVGRLAGGIAHDFNNLLTAIRGYTDLLADRTAHDEAASADLLEIRRAAERAAELTRQLLAFSRKQVVRPRVTDVGAVIDGLDPMLRRLIADAAPLKLSSQESCWVHIDQGQLEQIVVNLVVNARDAAPRTGIDITVRRITLPHRKLRTQLPPGEYVSVSVTDDGHGIDAETLPFVFEPFFTTKEVGKGTGLGLATVYGIARDSGGDAVIDSVIGEGTTVFVLLPYLSVEPAHEVDESETVPPADVAEPGTERILLVEDEQAVRLLAERVLSRRGYVVITATNGLEALEHAASTGPFDLLVTDVVMPAMGGIQLAAELIARQPDVSVLFISGYTGDTLPTADAMGRTMHFLEKPFSPASLVATVRSILDERLEPTGV